VEEPRHSVRIAMVQMLVEGGKPDANLLRACERIAESSRLGAEIAVLPECIDFGWTDPSAREGAQPIPGRHFELLSRAARESSLIVVAGLVERKGGRLFNSAVLIDQRGKLLLLHRKVNELDIARDLYETGTRLAVGETELAESASISAQTTCPAHSSSVTRWGGWEHGCCSRHRPGRWTQITTTTTGPTRLGMNRIGSWRRLIGWP
jgi:hypothetical protein